MTDNQMTWGELDDALGYLSPLQGQDRYVIMHHEIAEGVRHEMIMQVPYIIILARLTEALGTVSGWRCWFRWLGRKLSSHD